MPFVKWRANRKELRPGWKECVFRTWTREKQGEVRAWCEDQCRDDFSYHVYQYSQHGTDWGYVVWLLKDPNDAIGFKLRWLGT